MMDFITLSKERYSLRKFSKRIVEKEKIDLILKTAQLAPTAANFQPQRILVIDSEAALENLKECTPCHFNAPVALLVCYDKTTCWQRKYDNKNSGDIDASIVTTHMMMEAADLGLGSTWVMHFEPEKVKNAYHIPDTYEPVALLVLGYPADDAEPSKMHEQRNNLDTMVFYNDFS